MEIVIIIIAIIVYIIAGFIILSNDSASFIAKLFFAPVYIIIFVGMIIMGIADLIGDIKEKHRMKDPEYAEAVRKRHKQFLLEQRLKEKQDAENIKIQKQKEQEREALQRKKYIKDKAQEIADEIEKKSNTFTFIVGSIEISSKFHKTKSIFETSVRWGYKYEENYLENEIKLKIPMAKKTFTKEDNKNGNVAIYFDNFYKKNNEAYYLAEEINKCFNNTFEINEIIRYELCENNSFTYKTNEIEIYLSKDIR